MRKTKRWEIEDTLLAAKIEISATGILLIETATGKKTLAPGDVLEFLPNGEVEKLSQDEISSLGRG